MAGKKKSTAPNNKNKHSAFCKVCKHPYRSEIEELYLDGYSPYEICKHHSGFSVQSLYQHAKVMSLDKKRNVATLPRLRRLIDRANINYMPVKQIRGMLPKLLELEAKISGELAKGSEEKTGFPPINLSVNVINKLGDDKLAKGAEKLGLKIPANRFSDN